MAKSMNNIPKSILMMITYASLITISLVSASMSKSNSLTPEPTATNGFTTDLIHRDSPQSPSYDPSLSPSQRLVNSIRRSVHRIQHFHAKRSKLQSSLPISNIITSGGEYLMTYSIGTPPVPSFGIADTGSDIIWTQCQPCLQCFHQSLPLFNPKTSSTYKTIRCNTTDCHSLPKTSCSSKRDDSCLYSENYGDGSFTQGDLSTDTFTLASAGDKSVISVPNVVIGCGFLNGGVFNGGESGIVGLGGGEVSLVTQLGPLADGKFSYCLVSLSENSNTSSKLNFGANAVVSGRGAVSTPLVRKETDGYTFYYVTLLGISVGNQKLEMYDEDDNSTNLPSSNIIVDSGTTVTFLPGDFYGKLKSAMQSTMKLKQIADPTGSLDLCFYTGRDDVEIPDITVHFKGGADLKWKQENIFVRTSNVSLCLAAQAADDLAIYGSLAQTNFLVGYDLDKRTFSFKPTDCGIL